MANPNPSPETRFGGKRGNKPNGGKTSEQKKAEYAAAEKAAWLSDKLLSSIKEKIDGGGDALDFIDPNVMRLIKEAQDRAHGTPKQAIDHTNSDGSLRPQKVVIEAASEDDNGQD